VLLTLLVAGLVMGFTIAAPKLFLVHIRKGVKPKPVLQSEENDVNSVRTRENLNQREGQPSSTFSGHVVDNSALSSRSKRTLYKRESEILYSTEDNTENLENGGDDYMIQSGFQPTGDEQPDDGADSEYVHEDDDASWHDFDEAQDNDNGETVEATFSAEGDDYNYDNGSEPDDEEDVVADDEEDVETDDEEDVATDDEEDVVADDEEDVVADDEEDVVADEGMAYGDGYELDEIDEEIDDDIYELYDDENDDVNDNGDDDEEEPDAD